MNTDHRSELPGCGIINLWKLPCKGNSLEHVLQLVHLDLYLGFINTRTGALPQFIMLHWGTSQYSALNFLWDVARTTFNCQNWNEFPILPVITSWYNFLQKYFCSIEHQLEELRKETRQKRIKAPSNTRQRILITSFRRSIHPLSASSSTASRCIEYWMAATQLPVTVTSMFDNSSCFH